MTLKKDIHLNFDRFQNGIWSIPDARMILILVLIGCGWSFLTFADWLFGYGKGFDERGFLRQLFPLVLLTPLLIRWFRPLRRPADHQDAYRLNSGIVVPLLVMLGIITLLALFPLNFNSRGGPTDLISFLAAHSIGLALICGAGIILENLFLLFDYGSRSPRSAVDGLRACVVTAVVLAGISPGFFGEVAGHTLGGVAALIAFVLGLRAGWVVHIWKDQKYRMLGMAALGILAAIALMVILYESPVYTALHSLSPSLQILAYLVSVMLLASQSALFFRIFITLPTAGAMDRRNMEVSSLSNFGRLMIDSFNMNDLMQASIRIACDVTSGRSAWIELFDDDTREIITGGRNRVDFDGIEHVLNLNVSGNGRTVGQAAREEESIRVFNLILNGKKSRDGGPGFQDFDLPPGGSLAIVPLRDGDRRRGLLYVLKDKRNGFDRDDVTILGAVCNQITLAMEHADLIQRSIERERLRNEMLIAREAQQRLLPAHMPENDAVELYAESEPASMVGGDYYDMIAFSDRTQGVLIADVSGKGAGAALYMGMVKGVIRALSGACETPAELLARANAALYRNIDPRFFVTMTCLRILEETRTMQIARAGHCPTLVARRNGETTYHTPRGIGLALTSSKRFEQALALENLQCAQGDLIVLFSDGLAEARSHDGDELGFEGFRRIVHEAVNAHPDAPLRVLRDVIFEGISTFTGGAPPVDDSTLVMARWRM